jgi:hypothetical protein
MDEKQVKKLIDIIDHLNEITRILETENIAEHLSFHENRNAFHALCGIAAKSYEIAITCNLICNRDKYRTLRAQLDHTTDTLGTKEIKGFDEVSSEELWKIHFSDKATLWKLKDQINHIREKNPTINVAIDNQCIQASRMPIKLNSSADYSHNKIINQIALGITRGATYLIGTLFLLSSRSMPPTKEELFKLISKPTNLNIKQLKYIAYELEINKLIKTSAAGNYFLIVNKIFAENTAKEFINSSNLLEVIHSLQDIS